MEDILSVLVNYDVFNTVAVLGLVILSNIFTYKFVTREHTSMMETVLSSHHAERSRATEVINALRGIIYAFSDAQREDEQERRSPPRAHQTKSAGYIHRA